MKKIILIFIISLLPSSLLAQDKQNPNVELPDFVITGKDVISLQKAKKLDPGFISTISEEFIKPVFSPEELGIKDISNPIQNESGILNTEKVYSAKLNVVTGIYNSPSGNFTFTQPFGSGIFEAAINGENHRAYVENSDWYGANGGLNLSFFVPGDSKIRGTQFKIHGDYGLSSYKFFASNNPGERRNYYKGNISVDINNLVNRHFIFSLKAADEYSYLNKENFTENLIKTDGFFKANFSYFKIGSNINYTKQILKNNLIGSGNFDYLSVRPYVETLILNSFKIAAGINYSNSGSSNYLSPYASAALKINDFISLYGELDPHAEFVGSGLLLSQNMYFNTQNFANTFVKKTSDLDVSIKYEYFKYFEIDVGAKYFRATNLPYFVNSAQPGRFDVNFSSAKSYGGYINFLFHPGPAGMFYASIDYNDTKDLNGNYIPYNPKLIGSAHYSYNFGSKLYAEPKIFFSSQSYADLNNTIKVDSFINLGIKFLYKFVPNFSLSVELSNLLDRKNYKWMGYKESPLDFFAGFTYKW
ncbi:MAG TPA: hypothetical protein VKA26_05110 [Ignavibacteriaceae bacterium]|nr:hypothetical protein [Ignavibacteriaceae bacterium]